MGVVLETARLRLRHTEPDDLEFLVALYTDPEVTEFTGGPRDAGHVRDEIARHLAEDDPEALNLWVLEERTTGAAIGDAGLMVKNVDGEDELELVYMLHPSAWGRGLATEVAAALRDHAVIRLGHRRVIALIDPANLASLRVAVKIGMRHEKDTLRPSGETRRVYVLP